MPMLFLHVSIRVKPECVDAFLAATRDNVRESRKEAGVLRFDLGQQADDPTRFGLYEVYASAEGHAAHRQTPHYNTWRELAEPMMAEPRVGRRFVDVCPP